MKKLMLAAALAALTMSAAPAVAEVGFKMDGVYYSGCLAAQEYAFRNGTVHPVYSVNCHGRGPVTPTSTFVYRDRDRTVGVQVPNLFGPRHGTRHRPGQVTRKANCDKWPGHVFNPRTGSCDKTTLRANLDPKLLAEYDRPGTNDCRRGQPQVLTEDLPGGGKRTIRLSCRSDKQMGRFQKKVGVEQEEDL